MRIFIKNLLLTTLFLTQTIQHTEAFQLSTKKHKTLQSTNVSLFKAYPKLQQSIPHQSLGNFPTPIHKLEKLGTLLAVPNLYIKRDDQTSQLFGGNKIRKLEFLFGDALAHKAQGVLTQGFAGSNHTCATAVHAHALKLPCFCMHTQQYGTAYLRRNLLITHYYGGELNHYRGCGERNAAIREKNRIFKETHDSGLYFIPAGGSNEIGTLGFVSAAFELKEQIVQGIMPEPDVIYITVGSVGTLAGLALGLKAAGIKSALVPVCIEPDEEEKEHEHKFQRLFIKTNKLLHDSDPAFPLCDLGWQEYPINYDFIGKKYAKISPEARDAIKLLYQTEAIKLDGTYTGKTFAAMIHDITHGTIKDKVILFWNTFCSGDFSAITSKVTYKDLPIAYHNYFTIPLQDNDQGV